MGFRTLGIGAALGAWVALALAPGVRAESPAACVMSASDKGWIEQAVANWRVVETDILKLLRRPLPVVVAIDSGCSSIARPQPDGRLVWVGTPHSGKVTLPDGKSVPVGVMSFAAPNDGAARDGFFVMSLPSVWRAGGIKSGLGLERLMDAVLLHEMMHTRQFYFVNPRLAELGKQYGLPEDISDDSLQDAFKTNPAYVRDYERERDLLFAAAAAPSRSKARALARQALAAFKSRRARWLVGRDARWAPLDDIFLDMEGLGQWTAYAWLTSAKGPHLAPAVALSEVRRDRTHWTQDEGLGLFLTVDRLVPNWQKHAFAARPELAEALLERAAR